MIDRKCDHVRTGSGSEPSAFSPCPASAKGGTWGRRAQPTAPSPCSGSGKMKNLVLQQGKGPQWPVGSSSVAGRTDGTTPPLSSAPLLVARLEWSAVLSPLLAGAWLRLAGAEDSPASTARPRCGHVGLRCGPSAFLHGRVADTLSSRCFSLV